MGLLDALIVLQMSNLNSSISCIIITRYPLKYKITGGKINVSTYSISKIYATDKKKNRAVDSLLHQEGINRDQNLDYTCGIFDETDNLVGTGSCFKSSLRCLAVDHNHQGEGLMNKLVTHLMSFQFQRGNSHIFVYTKVKSAKFFQDLGFTEIARVADKLVFLENESSGFSDYLSQLTKSEQHYQRVAGVVINANPFSLGHQYLVRKACEENDLVHLFIVSQDSSLFPFSVRERLVKEGTAQFDNIIYHETGSYMISSSTFPSYFLKDDELVIKTQASLDIQLFIKIAQTLGINSRYVGEEPFSQVTGIYNEVMKTDLSKANIDCHIVPRLAVKDNVVSASKIRQAIKDSDLEAVRPMVPQSTFNFLETDEGKQIIERIQQSQHVIHY